MAPVMIPFNHMFSAQNHLARSIACGLLLGLAVTTAGAERLVAVDVEQAPATPGLLTSVGVGPVAAPDPIAGSARNESSADEPTRRLLFSRSSSGQRSALADVRAGLQALFFNDAEIN